jgi:hypothetical protein
MRLLFVYSCHERNHSLSLTLSKPKILFLPLLSLSILLSSIFLAYSLSVSPLSFFYVSVSVSFFIYHYFCFAISAVSIAACVLVYPLNLLSFYLSRPSLPLRFSLYLGFLFSSISLLFHPLLSYFFLPNSYISLLWLCGYIILTSLLLPAMVQRVRQITTCFGQQKSHLKAYNSWFSKFLVGAAT